MKKLGLLLLILLAILAVNAERIGRHYYPFHYQELVFHYSQLQRLDPYLVAAVIRTESNFRPGVESPKGALGLMQIMPETGRWIAEQLGVEQFEPEALNDVETNLMFGTWYLAHLYEEFGHDPVVVLAAYNAGRGNVQAWLREDRWTGEARNLEQVPFPETRQFIRKVLLHYRLYNFLYR